jgi:hypothetical protein
MVLVYKRDCDSDPIDTTCQPISDRRSKANLSLIVGSSHNFRSEAYAHQMMIAFVGTPQSGTVKCDIDCSARDCP